MSSFRAHHQQSKAVQLLSKHAVVTRAGLYCNTEYKKSTALLPGLGGKIQNHDTFDQMLPRTIGIRLQNISTVTFWIDNQN